jgi:hypothetical protein
MGTMENIYIIRVNTSTEVGKIKLMYEDNIKLDLRAGGLGIVGWISLT